MTAYYKVEGGTSLFGDVTVSGAKNAALPIIAAAVMTGDAVTIGNIPDITDIRIMLEAVSAIGASVEKLDRHTFRICGKGVDPSRKADTEGLHTIRSSYYLLGSLLGRFRKACVALPGGDDIGSRRMNLHEKGFRALGAEIFYDEPGLARVRAEALKGAPIYLDTASVGATMNIIMASVMAEGVTTIDNPAREPHIVDLANFLNQMGANIRGAGTDTIRITGVPSLHGTSYSIIPDQIEAGTFMIAGAATRGDITLHGVIPKHMESVTAKLREAGCTVTCEKDAIRVFASARPEKTNVTTLPYPGFPTDMQPMMTVLLGLSRGVSTVTENVFDRRFSYISELSRMGACIRVFGRTAVIEGVEAYRGSSLTVPDIRAGAALVIAALAAEGISEIRGIGHIERGYEDFPEKLSSLGARIEKAETDPAFPDSEYGSAALQGS
ncbi:MAG: UDP-N-acetylglucosamine 1-carboxyvinyltransferase [Lachnospiraceae bacterium]|nr:UDP-N-acetylglucosamine 1-carboxyvinyltransferase [Lachnospiraceae bacterium]